MGGRAAGANFSFLNRRWEFFVAGNAGTSMFIAFFQRELRLRANETLLPGFHIRCVLQHLLRPSAAVVATREQIRPASGTWKAARAMDQADRRSTRVGIHVRAASQLVSRAVGDDNKGINKASITE